MWFVQEAENKPAEAAACLSADFPELVDVVADENGEPLFLVLDVGEKLGVSVVGDYVPATGPQADKVHRPPP